MKAGDEKISYPQHNGRNAVSDTARAVCVHAGSADCRIRRQRLCPCGALHAVSVSFRIWNRAFNKKDGKQPGEKPGNLERVESSSVFRCGRPKNFPECIAVYGEKILKGCPHRKGELPGPSGERERNECKFCAKVCYFCSGD